MKVQIEESWRRQLQEEFDKPYFEHLVGFVKEEYARYTVFPPGSRIFHAYNTCPFEKVKQINPCLQTTKSHHGKNSPKSSDF